MLTEQRMDRWLSSIQKPEFLMKTAFELCHMYNVPDSIHPQQQQITLQIASVIPRVLLHPPTHYLHSVPGQNTTTYIGMNAHSLIGYICV